MTIQEWLNNDQLGIDIWEKKYRYNNESLDEWFDRVSGGDTEIKRLIIEKKFLFGGRTLSNRGTNRGSMSNCYSHGYIEDSLDGIMDAAKNIAMTYKAQGGQGLSLSKIRPKGASIAGKFKSDGIVPFMEIFNTVTESVSQGGSRKGALLMSLDINHPEAETFMTIKSDLNKINKANLSMEIDDDFMNRVISGDPEANRLFNILCTQACKYAEPGVIYTNRFRNYNLMEFVDSYQIETCNPCGEQPLAKHSACNLSSINLSEYVINPFTETAILNLKGLKNDIFSIVTAMDDIIDENLSNHALQEQKDQVAKFRNLGIGIMGLHDMFIKLGLVYGSKESIDYLSDLMKFIFRSSVYASVELGQIRGNFPGYDSKVWDANIIKNNFTEDEIKLLKKWNTLRNCSLLSVAPTGSIGTMLQISTGVEPWFSKSYIRNTKSLNGDKEVSYEVWAPVIKKALDLNWHPETLITANDIDYKGRIGIQSAIQNALDTAVSSTLNLPKTTTPEDIKNIYILAWKHGLKGVTAYVEGSRDPILTTDKNLNSKEILDLNTPIKKVSDNCVGKKRTLMTGCGSLHFTAFFDKYSGRLLETYCSKGSQGGCALFMTGLSRMMSLAARGNISVEHIVDQLKSAGTCPSYAVRRATKKDTSQGSSCPVAIGYALLDMYQEMQKELSPTTEQNCTINEKDLPSKHICPECGENLVMSEGCMSCRSCGYSRC